MPTTTSTTVAPAVVLPGNTTTAPPGEGEGEGGGGGSSSGRRLALVVGGLLAVAGAISALTFFYWRHTRPVPYNAALDALGDLAGPAPVAPAGSAVAGEPTVLAPGASAPVTSRTPEEAAALLAALVAEEGGGTLRGQDTPPEPASTPESPGPTARDDTPVGSSTEVPGEVPPIEPGGPGFRVMGAVAASGLGADLGSAGPALVEGDEAAPSGSAVATGVASAPMAGFEQHQFVTREDLEPASPTPDPPVPETAAVADPLANLLSEPEPGSAPPGSPGPVDQ